MEDVTEANNRPASRRAKGNRNRSITRHPLFPAIVALWFAALLGLGSFALSTSLLERLVLATHIDAVVPAAAPPLGMTARLALALLLGLVGAAIGFTLARRLGGSAEKPAPQVFKVADTDLAPFAPVPAPAATQAELPAPTERLAELIAEAMTAPAAEPAPAAPIVSEAEVPVAIDGPVMMRPAESRTAEIAPVVVPVEIEPEPVAAEPAAVPPRTAAQRIAAADLADLSHVELVERLAIALQRRRDRREDGDETAHEPASPVLQFPDLADRRAAHEAVPLPTPRAAPQQTEQALREALAALQRMTGTA